MVNANATRIREAIQVARKHAGKVLISASVTIDVKKEDLAGKEEELVKDGFTRGRKIIENGLITSSLYKGLLVIIVKAEE